MNNKNCWFSRQETAQLDKARALLEENSKLKDYCASLIYETVTEGLIKQFLWKIQNRLIGQVPEDGEEKIKRLCRIFKRVLLHLNL